MASKKIQLYTDRDKTIEASPETSANCVILSDGNDLQKVLDNDLTNPTVVHEETSFKVGVGDIDVSSSVVDGEVGRMVIKGQTYQNILPEPSTHVLTNNKEMFKVNEGLDPNVEIVDAVSKSAILTGQTLVNLATENSVQFTTASDWKHLKTNQKMLNTTKNYMVKFNSSHDYRGYVHLRDKATNTYITDACRNNFKKGSNVVLLGSFLESDLESFSNIVITFFSDSDSAKNLTIADVMLIEYQEGMENRDIPYFEGMQSVKMPVLTTSNEDGTKTNILHTPEEVVLRSLPNGVCDTLNLNTGEYAQRIGEITAAELEASDYYKSDLELENTIQFGMLTRGREKLRAKPSATSVCNIVPIMVGNDDVFHARFDGGTPYGSFTIWMDKTKLETEDVFGLIKWMRDNNAVIQYELAEPIIKTVVLSSSGNWEKVILDGSENWSVSSESSNNNAFFRGGNTVPNNVQVNSNNVAQKVICDILTPFTQPQLCNKPNDNYGISLGWNDSDLCVRHKDFPLTNEGLTQWKQYLSQNPITVWYQTTNHKDSTQVKQLIFFKDGHIQLSSGADSSLIPILDYQAKTSNSYVMDLMKTNTKYTMKAKSANGTFTIDGTSYGAGTNGTFATPSSMTNKLLVMSNKTNEEVMILEGDVTDKTIPYFKGIKSAFEDEGKIEVLSTGKNLFDKHTVLFSHSTDANGTVISSPQYAVSELISVRPNTVYTVKHFVVVVMYDKDKKYISQLNADYEQRTFTTPATCAYVRIRNWGLLDGVELQKQMIEKVVLQEGDTIVSYEPYKSNNTKIPLLSPLRSLPNGVCDELIIDRMKKKATLIQRVGKAALDGGENWSYSETIHVNNVRYWHNASATDSPFKGQVVPNGVVLCSHFPNIDYGILGTQDVVGVGLKNNDVITDFGLNFPLRLLSSRNDIALKKWLSQNPIIVYYELKTPVITEVDIEGFPYIYKDGHIFLNSEIAPVVEIDYNVNQSQLIIGNGETLLRHEQEILDLDKLIVSFVDCEYRLRLLKFDMELSMIALAE